MIEFFYRNAVRWGRLLLLTVFLAMANWFYLSRLELSMNTLILDTAGWVGCFLFCAFMVHYVQSYVRFGDSLSVKQQNFNYFLIYTFILIIGLGVNLILLSVHENSSQFHLTNVFPLKAMVCILLIVALLHKNESAIEEQEERMEEEVLLNEAPTTNSTIPKEYLERITVKKGTNIHLIASDDILFIEAMGDYVTFHTATGKYTKEETMKYLNEHLSPFHFARVHRSYIVKLSAISRIELYEKQSQQLTLVNGDVIKLSQAGYKALKSALQL